MTQPATITIQGTIISHKQMPTASITQIRTSGYTRVIEMPDLRDAGFQPGDEITITVCQKTAEKAADKARGGHP